MSPGKELLSIRAVCIAPFASASIRLQSPSGPYNIKDWTGIDIQRFQSQVNYEKTI